MSNRPTHFFKRRLASLMTVLLAGSLLSGCGTITGLDASDDFSCPMTPGTHCRSLSDTYADSLAGRTPDQMARARGNDAEKAPREDDLPSLDGALPSAVTGVDNKRSPEAGTPGSMASGASEIPRGTPPGVRSPGHAPARLPEVIVTIWIAPWTDDEGDFHEGERIHARAFDARWAAARRRADNASNRRAVVQLPFGSLGASRTSAAPVRPAPGMTKPRGRATPIDTPYGAGATAFRDARTTALQGSEFVRARFAEAGSDDASVGHPSERTYVAPVGGTDNLKVERTAGDAS